MLDVNIEAEKSLKKLDCNVVYQHPGRFEKLPAVSYYTVTECGGMYTDNEECIQNGYIQVDVWAQLPSECGRVSILVNEAMTADGWTREMSMDVPKNDEKIYHRTMRFQKYFNV